MKLSTRKNDVAESGAARPTTAAGPASRATGPEPGGTSAGPGDPPRRRLLLVEDDWRSHSALRKIFMKLGCEVHSAVTVSGGLALLDLNPEGVILDLMLPDGDGLGVLRKVRSERLASRVVVTTGVEDPDRLEEVRRLRPDGLLRKPFDFDELFRALGFDRPA